MWITELRVGETISMPGIFVMKLNTVAKNHVLVSYKTDNTVLHAHLTLGNQIKLHREVLVRLQACKPAAKKGEFGFSVPNGTKLVKTQPDPNKP